MQFHLGYHYLIYDSHFNIFFGNEFIFLCLGQVFKQRKAILNVNNLKMKKDNTNSELNNFHLQLYALEQQQSKINKREVSKQESFLYKVDFFPISISITSSLIYFSLYVFWIMNLLDTYLYTYYVVYSQPSVPLLHTITSLVFGNSILGYVINATLIVIIVVSFSFHYKEANQGILYFCWYFSSKTYEYLRYFIEGLFFSASYYACNADLFSILIFVLACLISCFSTIFLQNITLRKDQFCVKSLEFSFLLRISAIVSLVISVISMNQVFTSSQLIGCIIGHIIISFNLVICYYNFGLIIYRHDVARHSIFFMVVIYFCLSVSFLMDVLGKLYYSYQSSNIFLIFIITFIFIAFFFISTIQRIKRSSNLPNNKNLKNKVYFSFNKYEHADEDQELDCQIRGVLHSHYTHGCKNLECIANVQQLYDSKKKKKCSITKIAQGKVSIIKFYVKCLYETALAQNGHNKHLQVDFIEFNYLKLKNVFITLRKIIELEMGYLNFYEKLRLTRIKQYLIEESNNFSRQLYNQSISSCKIIASQETFEKIQQLIQIFLLRNELFWKYLSFNEVHLKQIIKIVRPNFKLMETISEEWGKINSYFAINRRWKFYYICFTIFIKNEKIKPSMIQDFGNSVQYDSIFKTDNYFVDKTTEKEFLCNPIMLFEQNTCYIHTRCDEDKMIVTKVSNFFQRNFQYDPTQIINSTINILMPPSIVKFHHPLFLSWIKEGRSNNEAFYEIKKIYPLTKRGFIYPCFKFYKRFIQISGEMQFIAMLKSNKQDEQMMLLNGNFQIEGITFSLHQKLKLTSQDYLYFKGINILALMPMLIKYTKYCHFITEKDEDFLEHDDNKNYFKKQSTLIKGKSFQEIQSTNILHQRKSLNLANVKLFLPNDFHATIEYYKHLLLVKKMEQFDAIRQLYRWIRKDKNYLKYKTQISIRQKEILKNIYYEVQINELEENNRLQKLKMSEMEAENANSVSSSRQIQQSRLNQIDMQLFFSMSKKRNKVVLFPSKNIFIKDENNKALTQIAHINNINIFIRISLFIFLSLVLVQMFIEINTAVTFDKLTNYYHQISRYEKLTFMLNTQYHIQHIQPGNSWEESFCIIGYTHQLIQNYNNSYFQALLYDKELNRGGLYPPFQLITPSNLTASRTQQSHDELSIFFKMYQCAIALHRRAEQSPQDTLQMQQYYEFNNYIYSFHDKAEDIKIQIQLSFDDCYNNLRNMDLIFGIVITVIFIGCLIFSVSRLWKVSNGFKELASILIQIDNNDMRDIIKYVDYTKYLFEHLNQKNQRMELQNDTQYSSTSGNFRSFQKKSSELTEQEQKFGNSANLNKKIKKIQIGQQITKMIFQSAVILLSTATLIGAILLSLNIYSIISLDQYQSYKQIGFNFMDNNGVNNIIASGTIQKFMNSNIYNFSKYDAYINQSLSIQSSNSDIKFTLGTSLIEQNLKILYFQNFCEILSHVLNESLTHQFDTLCDSTNADWCSYVYQALSQSKLIARCTNFQNGQLLKGLYNYNNFFLKQALPFFKDISNLTLQNIVEINDIYKIVDIFIFQFMHLWNEQAESILAKRESNIILIVVCVFLSTMILNIIFIEYLVKRSLTEKYQIFRLIHQHYIPEWIIIKEKIIKVKLIKEGFMKQ